MQNKNLRKILLASLGALAPLVSGSVNAAKTTDVKKSSDKVISDKTTEKVVTQKAKDEKGKTDKDKSASRGKTTTDIKKGSNLPTILKLIGAFAGGGAVVETGNLIYNKFIKDKTDALFADWDKRDLLRCVMRGKEFHKIAKMTELKDPKWEPVDAGYVPTENDIIELDNKNNKFKLTGVKIDFKAYDYALNDYRCESDRIYKSKEVLNVYNQLYKLYYQLLHDKRVEELVYKESMGYTADMVKKYYVKESVRNFLGIPKFEEFELNDGSFVYFWNVLGCFYDYETKTPFLSCDMPDGTFTYESTITEGCEDANCTKPKNITYRATFKKENGKLTFEKLEFND